MERKDLIGKNIMIYKAQGEALERVASRDVKILVVANPANTNCLVLQKYGAFYPCRLQATGKMLCALKLAQCPLRAMFCPMRYYIARDTGMTSLWLSACIPYKLYVFPFHAQLLQFLPSILAA